MVMMMNNERLSQAGGGYSRLSDQNITDPILRGEFYRQVVEHLSDPTTKTTSIRVFPNEEYRPDLMAFRLYGDADLRWLVCLVCGVTDEADPLPVGDAFAFPPSTWLRQKMRQFIDLVG